jgi:hypothetical protein
MQPLDGLQALLVIADIPEYQASPFPLACQVLHFNPVIGIDADSVALYMLYKRVVASYALLTAASGEDP